MTVRAALSWMPTPAFREAAGAAWSTGAVGALEVTLEHAFGALHHDDRALIEAAAAAGRLIGHGVHFSVLSSTWTARDRDWLARVAGLARRWRFARVTEHFGCVRAGGVWAAPLPVPFTRAALDRGVERLRRLRDAVEAPVGLENLALAWSAADARRQADFVDALLEPVDGSMVLDLHNLWCQAVNFDLDPVALIEVQPVARVRQLHVSGGSWAELPEGRFRRDTHDGPVPEEVWALIPEALARCPGVEAVSLERLGPAIEVDPSGYRAEVDRLAQAARPAAPVAVAAAPRGSPDPGDPGPAWDAVFASRGPEALRAAGGGWLDGADPRAIRTAAHLLERWGRPA